MLYKSAHFDCVPRHIHALVIQLGPEAMVGRCSGLFEHLIVGAIDVLERPCAGSGGRPVVPGAASRACDPFGQPDSGETESLVPAERSLGVSCGGIGGFPGEPEGREFLDEFPVLVPALGDVAAV